MPDKTIVYVSGAMSGEESYNFPAFDKAAQDLRDAGFRVINPADFGAEQRFTWEDCIARDLYILNFAHVIAQLPGWDLSRGARMEAEVGAKLGKRIFSLAELLSPRVPMGHASRPITDDEEWETLVRRYAG